MDPLHKQFHKLASRINLDPTRKHALKQQLIQAIDQMPVRPSPEPRQHQQRSNPNAFNNIIFNQKSMPIALIALVALLGGGASVAAQHSLPGDFLYPVKVHVNEEVRAGLTLGAQNKAQWDAQRAETRLEEAAELSVKEKVDTQVTARIEASFQTFADRVQQRIDALKASGDVEAAATIASQFETALSAHQKVLANLSSRDQESKTEVEGLHSDVKTTLQTTMKARTNLETEISAKSHGESSEAAQGKINAAENVIASVQSGVQRNEGELSAEASAKVQARIAQSQTLVVQAKAKADAKAYGEAFNLAQAAIRVAQEARTLITIQGRLNKDLEVGGRVRESGSPAPASSIRSSLSAEQHKDDSLQIEGRTRIELNF